MNFKSLCFLVPLLVACAPVEDGEFVDETGKADDFGAAVSEVVLDVHLLDFSPDSNSRGEPGWEFNEDESAWEFRAQFTPEDSQRWSQSLGDFTLKISRGTLRADFFVGDGDASAEARMKLPMIDGELVDPGPEGYALHMSGGDFASGQWRAQADVTLRVAGVDNEPEGADAE